MTVADLHINIADQTLHIQTDRADIAWPLPDIRTVPDQADPATLVLARHGGTEARLLVDDPETARLLRPRCPNLNRRPRPRGLGRLAGWAVAAVGSVALILTLLVPLMADQLARFLPSAGEEALGATTLTQIRRVLSPDGLTPVAFCEEPDGLAALDAMVQQVTGNLDVPFALSVRILDLDQINAFALPGGHITFFSGLIDAAETPEEVAAVLAHEIGHVVARDPTRIALRSAGSIGVLGLLLGDFAGGAAVLFLVERLIAANYSQAAEAQADAFATDLLRTARIDPAALGDFFERLRENQDGTPGLLAHFQSHPVLIERIEAARSAAGMDAPDPVLTEDEWQALRAVCP